MDTSPEYIKMCEKAEEIQKEKNILPQYRFGAHDFWAVSIKDWVKTDDETMKLQWQRFEINRDSDNAYEDKIVWLPRQDQLQEMIRPERSYTLHYAFGLHGWVLECQQIAKEETNKILEFRDASAEKVLLRFVMFFFNKTWNGEEWV